LSKRIYRGDQAEGDWRNAVSVSIPKEELRLKSNARANAAYTEERRRGYEKGYEAGHAEGVQQGREQALAEVKAAHQGMLNALAEELHTASERLEEAAKRFWMRSESELRELAVAIAEVLLKQELRQNPESILSVVRDAIMRVANSRDVRVRVSLSDLPTLKASQQELVTALQGVERVEITAADIQPGGCVVESTIGIVDASVNSQIEQIQEVLRGEAA
jgi:flagellar assembly protein FliH